MDLEPQDGYEEDFPGGDELVTELSLTYDGHTYIYRYSSREAPLVMDVLAHQSLAGRLPMIAASILGELVLEGFDNDADF